MSGWTKEGDTWVPPANVRPHRHDSSEVPVAGATPVGGVIAFYGTTAPTNWLICDGSTFSSSTYPALSVVLGGTTLPNLKGKVIVGIDAAQVEFDVLAETGGEKTHVLTTAELASHGHSHTHGSHSHSHTHGSHVHSHDHGLTLHNHGGGTGVHSHSFTGAVFGTSNTAHTHYVGGGPGEASAAPQGAGRAGSTADISTVGVANTTQGSNDATATTPTPDATTATPTTDATTAGSDTAHNNLQPYMALSYIIRAA